MGQLTGTATAQAMQEGSVGSELGGIAEIVGDCQSIVNRMLVCMRGPRPAEAGPASKTPPGNHRAALSRAIRDLNVLQMDLSELEKQLG